MPRSVVKSSSELDSDIVQSLTTEAKITVISKSLLMFFTGSVPEAIQTSKRQQKPLIVFLKGTNQISISWKLRDVFRRR